MRRWPGASRQVRKTWLKTPHPHQELHIHNGLSCPIPGFLRLQRNSRNNKGRDLRFSGPLPKAATENPTICKVSCLSFAFHSPLYIYTFEPKTDALPLNLGEKQRLELPLIHIGVTAEQDAGPLPTLACVPGPYVQGTLQGPESHCLSTNLGSATFLAE